MVTSSSTVRASFSYELSAKHDRLMNVGSSSWWPCVPSARPHGQVLASNHRDTPGESHQARRVAPPFPVAAARGTTGCRDPATCRAGRPLPSDHAFQGGATPPAFAASWPHRCRGAGGGRGGVLGAECQAVPQTPASRSGSPAVRVPDRGVRGATGAGLARCEPREDPSGAGVFEAVTPRGARAMTGSAD